MCGHATSGENVPSERAKTPPSNHLSTIEQITQNSQPTTVCRLAVLCLQQKDTNMKKDKNIQRVSTHTRAKMAEAHRGKAHPSEMCIQISASLRSRGRTSQRPGEA